MWVLLQLIIKAEPSSYLEIVCLYFYVGGDNPLCTLSISREKNLNSGLKVSQNSLKKIKSVIILSGEKMGKMGENWCVVTVTIAFCMNISLLLGRKKITEMGGI